MKRMFLPFISARLVVIGKKTTFYTDTHELVVEAPPKLMEQIVAFCNGKKTVSQLISSLKNDWNENSLRDLIKELRNRGVLINGVKASEEVWGLVENPIGFP